MEFDNDDIVRVAMLGVAFDGAPGDEAKAIKARFDAEVARLDSCSNILVLVAERLLNGRPASLSTDQPYVIERAYSLGEHLGAVVTEANLEHGYTAVRFDPRMGTAELLRKLDLRAAGNSFSRDDRR